VPCLGPRAPARGAEEERRGGGWGGVGGRGSEGSEEDGDESVSWRALQPAPPECRGGAARRAAAGLSAYPAQHSVDMSAPSASHTRQRSKTPLISRSASGKSGRPRLLQRYSQAK